MRFFFSKINVDDINGSDGEYVMICFYSSIALNGFQFIGFFWSNGEHILYVVDIDVDKGIGKENGRAFIVIGNESISNCDNEDNYDEDAGKHDEDVATPEFCFCCRTYLSVSYGYVEDIND